MRVQTLLNRVQKYKCFVYSHVKPVRESGRLILLVEIQPRANSQAKCSRCGYACPGYDTLKPRRFEFVPLWGIPVFFLYAMRRVNCLRCGIVVESVPWADGKCHLTTIYAWFLAAFFIPFFRFLPFSSASIATLLTLNQLSECHPFFVFLRSHELVASASRCSTHGDLHHHPIPAEVIPESHIYLKKD